jgi:hypothetical protein
MVMMAAAQNSSTTLLTPKAPSPPKMIGQLNRCGVGGTSNANSIYASPLLGLRPG